MNKVMEESNENVVVYIIPHKIQKKRLADMKAAAKKHKFIIAEQFRDGVTHVVSEYDSAEKVLDVLKVDKCGLRGTQLLSINWFTESMKAKSPVAVKPNHLIPYNKVNQETTENKATVQENGIPDFSCLRSTPLKHHNTKFTDALELLQHYAEMKNSDEDYMRALAWRRASCVLKSLKYPLTNIRQIHGAKDIGKHAEEVIQHILDDGSSGEVEKIRNDPWYIKMKIFTQIFGVGTQTAKEWISLGWSTIEEAQTKSTSKDWRVQWDTVKDLPEDGLTVMSKYIQQLMTKCNLDKRELFKERLLNVCVDDCGANSMGLAFHDELVEFVSKQEANNFTMFIKHCSEKILPGVSVELCGGFRRGKPHGHDIDLLFTHPTHDIENGFLPQLLSFLESQNLILCGQWQKSTFTREAFYNNSKLSKKGQLDHFEKWIGIIKFPQQWKKSLKEEELMPEEMDVKVEEGSYGDCEPPKKKHKKSDISPSEMAKQPRDWVARRADLIVAPYDQYFYALVGWTGSKQFNRDIRTYATRTHNYMLTSHGLYDLTEGKSIPASSEKEVFDLIKVPYFPPEERNC